MPHPIEASSVPRLRGLLLCRLGGGEVGEMVLGGARLVDGT